MDEIRFEKGSTLSIYTIEVRNTRPYRPIESYMSQLPPPVPQQDCERRRAHEQKVDLRML
jgi:hypothetical protein